MIKVQGLTGQGFRALKIQNWFLSFCFFVNVSSDVKSVYAHAYLIFSCRVELKLFMQGSFFSLK